MSVINVILSGGVGSRLWPLSRKSCPKQYVKLFGEKTLFQLTAERNRQFTDRVLVVGNKDNYRLSEEQLKEIGIDNSEILTEASPRNTAPAITFAALAVEEDEILLVSPSDQIIDDPERYEDSINRAIELANRNFLVTFGLNPTKPETGYGYIEYQDDNVIAFKEKPDIKTAKKYFTSGNYLWNSGIFCFSAGAYLQELKAYRPDIYRATVEAFEKSEHGRMPEEETMNIPKESIDYAVMEQSDKIKVVSSSFTWSDLGSFESLFEYFSQKESQSFIKDKNLVYSDKHVEIIGMENISVVETEKSILILPNEKAQEVKKVYRRLEKELPELVE